MTGDDPLRRYGYRIGCLGVLGLVLLRVSVGWHFLYQGIWKLQTPNFSAAGFLSQAKGPLAEHFYDLVPDIDGVEHLDFEKQLADMRRYEKDFAAANKFDDKQAAAADRALERRETELLDYLTVEGSVKDPETGKTKKGPVLKEEFDEHLKKLKILAEHKAAATRTIPYEQKRIWEEQQRLRAAAAGWSRSVDDIREAYKADLIALVPGDRVSLPAEKGDELKQIDKLVTYTNIAIGVCLIIGLFTRFSAAAGALFLLQIVLAQPDWPGLFPHPHPSAGRSLIVNKEFVEMMVLVALALLPTGRWAGLDHFVHNLLVRPLLGKKGSV